MSERDKKTGYALINSFFAKEKKKSEDLAAISRGQKGKARNRNRRRKK